MIQKGGLGGEEQALSLSMPGQLPPAASKRYREGRGDALVLEVQLPGVPFIVVQDPSFRKTFSIFASCLTG